MRDSLLIFSIIKIKIFDLQASRFIIDGLVYEWGIVMEVMCGFTIDFSRSGWLIFY